MSAETEQSELILFVRPPLRRDDPKAIFTEDIFSERFMLLMAKRKVNYKLMTVDPGDKTLNLFGQEVYVDAALKLPWLLPIIPYVDQSTGQTVRQPQELITDIIDIEKYIMKIPRPSSNLPVSPSGLQAQKKQQNIYSKFMRYIKKRQNDSEELNKLNSELRAIDVFLLESPGVFLSGDSLTLQDCYLLPKLHHLRVVCRHYKKFEISDEFTAIKRYLEAADADEDVQKSRASDAEIIEGYKRHYGTE